MTVSGRWIYLYRAVDQDGQVIDVLASDQRDLATARSFFTRALSHGRRPIQVTTDQAASYQRILDELLPAAHHVDTRQATNRIASDHSQPKTRLRPMRGLTRLRSAQTISSGHANVAEHPPRPLRTRPRRRPAAAGVGCLHRARAGDLISSPAGRAMSCFRITQQPPADADDSGEPPTASPPARWSLLISATGTSPEPLSRIQHGPPGVV